MSKSKPESPSEANKPITPGKLKVDVVSDIVCPWCYVGMRHLEIAMEALPEIDFDLHWRPFQLNPQMPKEGISREEYMANKFGAGQPTEDFYKQLEELGAKLDINFQFKAIGFAPNTLDAHRLIHWAGGGKDPADGADQSQTASKYGHQTDLVTKLFEIYFEQGGDLGNQQVLREAAQSLGMNGQLVDELLGSERDVDAIKEQVASATKLGISGVPCFIIESKYAVMGAQKPEALIEAFEQASEEKSEDYLAENANA